MNDDVVVVVKRIIPTILMLLTSENRITGEFCRRRFSFHHIRLMRLFSFLSIIAHHRNGILFFQPGRANCEEDQDQIYEMMMMMF
jgi:hypothetical protein